MVTPEPDEFADEAPEVDVIGPALVPLIEAVFEATIPNSPERERAMGEVLRAAAAR
jgi:hypothetical protein